ncbi:shikimate dehydrogenase [Pseudoteredinibacter isoporae]|uniref:Shikimate dehydrogenase (NADP(+)) n=1 Tax=Pseudoteredinibacter isoporae TaxID=570281 RepID=A0A7X0MUL4_9GAMM|nr:shikimate dehydrogenase [Pseudoteredinibacter isoporae]NHO85727.1 shikimate dehydrogenase [Pseudoteredinibacter isoporae]NIB25821.1 shikimate dehydrogenase [Pseudoteredinibacter isoporae]
MTDHQADRYAVVGNPIAHSKSPAIHSEFARQCQELLSYEAICAEDFAVEAKTFFQQGGKGMNVTVPFKLDALSFADELSPRASRAGASNTLILKADGRICAENTDGVGMVRDIQSNLGWRIADQRVLIVGAGGAVRGILEPLLAAKPKSVHIANRTVSKAEALATEFNDLASITASGFEDIAAGQFDLIINGSAASLQGDRPPLADDVARDCYCYDMMYGAEPTVFMVWASQYGAAAVADGLGMLVEQAAESFYLWRGKRPDTAPVLADLRQKIQLSQ